MEPHGPNDADDNGPLDGSWNGHHGKTSELGGGVTSNTRLFLSVYVLWLTTRVVCKDYGHIIPYLEGKWVIETEPVQSTNQSRTNIHRGQTGATNRRLGL